MPRHIEAEEKPVKKWHTTKTLIFFGLLHAVPLGYCVYKFKEAKRYRLENGIKFLPNNP